jgi:hypothetical protein
MGSRDRLDNGRQGGARAPFRRRICLISRVKRNSFVHFANPNLGSFVLAGEFVRAKGRVGATSRSCTCRSARHWCSRMAVASSWLVRGIGESGREEAWREAGISCAGSGVRRAHSRSGEGDSGGIGPSGSVGCQDALHISLLDIIPISKTPADGPLARRNHRCGRPDERGPIAVRAMIPVSSISISSPRCPRCRP